ncbi:MAG: GumC family protein [Halothece sp.]
MTSASSPYNPEINTSNSASSSEMPTFNESEQSFNAEEILAAARRRAWIIILVAIAVTGTMWTRALLNPPDPRYRSGFQLLVEPIAGDDQFQRLSEDLPGGATRTDGIDYDTQIRVLKSQQVLKPVHEKLQEDYPNLSYGALEGNLNVNRDGETKILRVSYESSDPGMTEAVTQAVAQRYTEYSEEQQQVGKQRVLELIADRLPTLQERVESLQDEIQDFRQDNEVIDPVETANQYSSTINSLQERQQATQIEIQENTSLRDSLLEQLGLSLEEAMTTVALSEAPRYQELLNQLKEVETEIALELGRFTEDSPDIQALEQQRDLILELLREESSAVLGEERVPEQVREQVTSPNPIRLSLTQELIEATNQIRVLNVRESALEEAEADVREKLEGMTDLAREYEGINQRLNTAQDNLNRMVDRREQLTIQAAQQTLPWQTLEEPSQAGRLPQEENSLMLGLVAGLLAGAGAAYLAEKMDNKFHSPQELKAATNLPMIGVIPHEKKLQALYDSKGDFTANGKAQTEESSQENESALPPAQRMSISDFSFNFSEAFRSLHTNLSFMNPDFPIKSLVISSSIPAEGKSTITLNLAQAAAAMGKRVLLVDGDLRMPQIHQILQISNQHGLSSVISRRVSSEEAIQQSPINNNLYILTSGPLPPDATTLLSSTTMKQLAQEWEESFDLVLYDSPPMGGLADARILTPLTNGLVLVVGLGIVNRSMLKDVIDVLGLAKTKVLGTVANGLVEGTISDYHYYYAHYYSEKYKARSNSEETSLVSTNGYNNDNSSSGQ